MVLPQSSAEVSFRPAGEKTIIYKDKTFYQPTVVVFGPPGLGKSKEVREALSIASKDTHFYSMQVFVQSNTLTRFLYRVIH